MLPVPLLQALRGFAMGAADIVPGVSGGTIALVLGIYERLVANIHTGAQALKELIRGNGSGFVAKLKQVEWVWLLSLLAGILVAVALLSRIIERLLNEYPIQTAGLFFGLVTGSVLVAWRLIDRFEPSELIVLFGMAVAMFMLLGLRADTSVAADAARVVTEPWWIFFLSGAVAICAMILPGVSGSFLLVMLGMYTQVLGAVNDRDLVPLIAFALGAVVGLALFSSMLTWALDKYHDTVIAAMIGLMVGSLRVLWPWPGGTHTTSLGAPSGPVLVTVLLAAVGFGAVIAMEAIATKAQSTRPSGESPSGRRTSVS